MFKKYQIILLLNLLSISFANSQKLYTSIKIKGSDKFNTKEIINFTSNTITIFDSTKNKKTVVDLNLIEQIKTNDIAIIGMVNGLYKRKCKHIGLIIDSTIILSNIRKESKKSILRIYRPSSFAGSANSYNVYVGQKMIGKLSNNNSFDIQLNFKGETCLRIGGDEGGPLQSNFSLYFPILLASVDTMYFRFSIDLVELLFEEVSSTIGIKEFENTNIEKLKIENDFKIGCPCIKNLEDAEIILRSNEEDILNGEKVFKDSLGNIVSYENAIIYDLNSEVNFLRQTYLSATYKLNGQLLSKKRMSFSNFSYKHGESIYYYPDGKIKWIGNYFGGKKIGELKSYYENGKIKEISIGYLIGSVKLASSFDTLGRNYIYKGEGLIPYLDPKTNYQYYSLVRDSVIKNIFYTYDKDTIYTHIENINKFDIYDYIYPLIGNDKVGKILKSISLTKVQKAALGLNKEQKIKIKAEIIINKEGKIQNIKLYKDLPEDIKNEITAKLIKIGNYNPAKLSDGTKVKCSISYIIEI